ncbi:membrane protein [Photobacterium kishitanii]|uniref:DoxX family protein n=1 Tax=Photobacterium kishitanii TaxID=318456 RepID=A0A2T3QTC7_9GAMM|nr:DoxX family protein [Photobacterium kishitanii]KJG08990.1 membrane protein [Photobacterium kishitanii]KJG56109.1 membrane protein [Photobacterium kishitanii]KJG59523.1 membrane protein [Photobacterium kishitanii]KJG64242.1 membrane protein [Photobacterium kishitanii]KJG68396.1 membrane protein [Photobacterium kishitanii]
MINFIRTIDPFFEHLIRPLQPLLLLFSRVWVAIAFFKSGLIKYGSWESTLYLFEYEYLVPILPWQLAAYSGTAIELIVPIFLALGLFSRPMALLLFGFNIIAVVSYPALWQQGFYDHQLWGMMLLVTIFWGAGKLSLDQWLNQCGCNKNAA